MLESPLVLKMSIFKLFCGVFWSFFCWLIFFSNTEGSANILSSIFLIYCGLLAELTTDATTLWLCLWVLDLGCADLLSKMIPSILLAVRLSIVFWSSTLLLCALEVPLSWLRLSLVTLPLLSCLPLWLNFDSPPSFYCWSYLLSLHMAFSDLMYWSTSL